VPTRAVRCSKIEALAVAAGDMIMQKPIAQSIAGIIAIAAAVLCLTVPVVADDATPDTAGGRYMFSRQPSGQGNSYLRLDTQTGEVSLCSQKAVGWACEAAPEDRATLENEIARLRTENAALKKDLLARGLPLPAGVMPEPPLAQNDEPANAELGLHLPSDADIDRMAAIVGQVCGHVWHRLVDAVERAQKQVLNRS
jgi:hypothetical protein